MLRIKGLTKRYRTGDLALKGIDIDVPDGQVMALIGPSGAGKSTRDPLHQPAGRADLGSIELNGVDIVKLGSAELRRTRRRMGMIFQEYALVERLSVMENVLTGRLGYVGFWQSWLRRFPQSDIDEAFRLLDRVGLDHMVDKRADALSGGQRQRVGICRALMQESGHCCWSTSRPPSLDPKTSRQIMRLIKELCAERDLSAIINIHDVMLAQMFAERIVGLRQGEIVYDGAARRAHAGGADVDLRRGGLVGDDPQVDEQGRRQVVPFEPPPRSRPSRGPDVTGVSEPGLAGHPRHGENAAAAVRTPPLEKAAAHQVGLAALDAVRSGLGLSHARASDDAGELDARRGRVCRAVAHSSPRFSRPISSAAGSEIAEGILESLWMTVTATSIGMALVDSRRSRRRGNLAPRRFIFSAAAVLALSRTFQEVIIAILFVKMFGFGPFAGMVTLAFATIGFYGKLLGRGHRGHGSRRRRKRFAPPARCWRQWINYGVQPQVMPRMIGLGALSPRHQFSRVCGDRHRRRGGIGATLNTAFDRYEFNSAAAILLVIIVIVMMAKYSSGHPRAVPVMPSTSAAGPRSGGAATARIQFLIWVGGCWARVSSCRLGAWFPSTRSGSLRWMRRSRPGT